MSAWAMTSRALWGGLVSLVVALVIVVGTVVGTRVAQRRASAAELAAVATARAAPAGRPVQAGAVQGISQPGVVGVVLRVRAGEIDVKARSGQTGRILITPQTKIRKRGAQASLADVMPGDQLVALGPVNRSERAMRAKLIVVEPRLLDSARR